MNKLKTDSAIRRALSVDEASRLKRKLEVLISEYGVDEVKIAVRLLELAARRGR